MRVGKKCWWKHQFTIVITGQNEVVFSVPSFSYYYQEGSLDKISELLADFDTGISNVAIKKLYKRN